MKATSTRQSVLAEKSPAAVVPSAQTILSAAEQVPQVLQQAWVGN